MPNCKQLKHREKQKIIEKLIVLPEKNRRIFWPKELKFFNDLYKLYPINNFWKHISFSEKKDSLLYYRSGYGLSLIAKKYLEYNYIPKSYDPVDIGEKCGKDFKIIKKPKTIKQFLDDE